MTGWAGTGIPIAADGSILVTGGTGGGSSPASATTPIIVNITTYIAGAEYSYTFPTGTKQFTIRARGNAKIQMAYSPGQSGTIYKTIFPGTVRTAFNVALASLTVYFQSSKAGEVVEIESWV